ncbi:MAG: hypothetical protein LKE85_01870 [Lachnospiraceae bacterium]|jgi:hypothetical protein|nr:hypothetical protein [Lachnospiraceae bacterium]MDD5850341.1 hypothetical protein [Bacillota bacterium]
MESNLMFTDEQGVRHCAQCPNQCPETNLSCGRGRSLFAGENPSESGDASDHHHGGYGHGGHDHDHHHGGHGHHGA